MHEVKTEPSEVASIFSISLDQLTDDSLEKQELRNIYGHAVEVPYFAFNGHKVWGATAMILSEFKQVLKQAQIGL